MAYTIADYAASTKQSLTKGVINAMLDDGAAGGGNLLQVIPIAPMDALSQTVNKVNTEGPSSGVAYRAIGGNFPEGTMTFYQETFNAAMVGGDINIDLAFLKAKNYLDGATPDVSQIEYKTMLINRTVNNTIMNGDRSVDINSFNGLRKWLDSGNVLNVTDIDSSLTNGCNVGSSFTAANGKTFLQAIDRLIDFIGGGDNGCLVMNWHAKWALYRSVRDAGFFETTKDAYDRKIDTYRGIPLVNPGAKTAVEVLTSAYSDTNAVLPNNITFGGASTACEIYALKLGVDKGVALYEMSPLNARTVAEEAPQAPAKIIRIDWYPTIFPKTKSAIACLKGVIAK